jgi:hypothetical protein
MPDISKNLRWYLYVGALIRPGILRLPAVLIIGGTLGEKRKDEVDHFPKEPWPGESLSLGKVIMAFIDTFSFSEVRLSSQKFNRAY